MLTASRDKNIHELRELNTSTETAVLNEGRKQLNASPAALNAFAIGWPVIA